MQLLDQVAERIGQGIATLTGRVETAAAFAALTASGELPDATPAAFVVPLGFNASPRASATAHVQATYETIGVILVASYPGDATAARAMPDVADLVNRIAALIAGWAPEGSIDNFDVTRGRLIDIRQGTVFYQIDFTIQGTLRP